MDTSKFLKVGLIVAGAVGVGYFIYKKFIVKPVASTAASVTPSALSTSTSTTTSTSSASSGAPCANCSTEELAILNSPTTAQAQSIIDKIKATPDWYASTVTKAKNNNIPVDQQLKLDAVWVINHG
jgi:hypothetical protein